MEVKKGLVASLLLLVVLLASPETFSRGQASQCEKKSEEFHGFCMTGTCRAACKNEGFEDGYCHFRWIFPLNRKCMCQGSCFAAPGPEKDAPDEPLNYSTNLWTTDLGR